MNKQLLMMMVAILVLVKCNAATHYVVPPGTAGANPTDPYTNWATAGTNIIEVVNAATTNTAPRVVWVTNGTYYLTNQIVITSLLTLQSVNGRDLTILNGSLAGTNRCAWLNAVGAVFNGFTVSNFNAIGQHGGVYIDRNSTVINSLFVNNSNRYTALNNTGGGGGGIMISTAAGVIGGTITNCIFKNNWAQSYGGGIYCAGVRMYGCIFDGNQGQNYYGGGISLSTEYNVISNCTVINNLSIDGAGITALGSGSNDILNCTITGNVARAGSGGGVYYGATKTLTIKNCSIIANVATNRGGGVCGLLITMRNCLIARNNSVTNIGGGIWMTTGIVESCTIVSNYAKVSGGGVYIDGPGSSGTNNIIYFNTAGVSANNFTNTAGNTGLNYSCVIPAVDGTGNITNNPLLVDLGGGNYRLQKISPCINAGTNQSWMNNAIDLDGIARIRYGIVDMGAYEMILRQGNIYRVR